MLLSFRKPLKWNIITIIIIIITIIIIIITIIIIIITIIIIIITKIIHERPFYQN
jgi:hypothetical protein